MARMRDVDEFMRERNETRGRFGDDEVRGNDSVRSDLVDLTLQLRCERPSSIAVSDPAKPRAAPWTWLPRSQIEIEKKSASVVVVTVPKWLAREKGLI
jgi:hypothetical protein